MQHRQRDFVTVRFIKRYYGIELWWSYKNFSQCQRSKLFYHIWMRKEYFRQTGCYLSKCIRSIRKTVNTAMSTTSSRLCISIEESIICIHSIRKTVNTVISTTSSRLCISIKEKYWVVQTDNLKERMAGMNKDKIIEAIYQLKHEDEAYPEGIIERSRVIFI